MTYLKKILLSLALSLICTNANAGKKIDSYPIVDTGQTLCYNAQSVVPCPKPGSPFFGQDAQYQGNAPAFLDNGDGTITDLVTSLTWSRAVDAQKVSLEQALKIAEKMTQNYSNALEPKAIQYHFINHTPILNPQSTTKKNRKPRCA